MRIEYSYRDYPLSEKLTLKSKRTGYLTSPFFGVCLGLLAAACIGGIFPAIQSLSIFVIAACVIAGPYLLGKLREKLFAKYDAEYEAMVRSIRK